ncbi:MAG: 16S rRNA (guanine(966)-N(2))-methyltransferase RsmD [Bdellovibrionota bacterium]
MICDPSHSFLRIIAGKLKGRRFDAPKGGTTVRPISDRIKESLFDILASRMEEARVLDLFSGTGAIGFECISRGASSIQYVERDPRNVSLIKKNAEKLQVQEQISVYRGDLPMCLSNVSGPFDLIFMDPPFPDDNMEELLDKIYVQNLLCESGLITIQRFRGSREIESQHFELKRKHRVGDSHLWFFALPSKGLQD